MITVSSIVMTLLLINALQQLRTQPLDIFRVFRQSLLLRAVVRVPRACCNKRARQQVTFSALCGHGIGLGKHLPSSQLRTAALGHLIDRLNSDEVCRDAIDLSTFVFE